MNSLPRPVDLNEQNFEDEVVKSDRPVLVDLWAAWCPPCRLLAPAVDRIAVRYAESAKVAKLNVDEYPEIASAYGIRSIPALLFFRGGRVVDRLVGAVPQERIEERLEAVLARN